MAATARHTALDLVPDGTSARTPRALGTVGAMGTKVATCRADRVAERRRAVALARHFREAEGLSIAQIADPSGTHAGDDQGVFLRPDRRKGTSGQGPLRRRVPRLRRVHAAARRQGRRLRLLQLRREALCRIPGAAGRNSKGCSWVQWLTRIRKMSCPGRGPIGVETRWHEGGRAFVSNSIGKAHAGSCVRCHRMGMLG
jgi:hypothetical protein